MASNSFGTLFRITTWGESHGKAIGVVIDGCPAGIKLCEQDIQQALTRRAPGNNAYTSPRKEKDAAEIYSGVFEGQTTGAPISIIIKNNDADPSQYEPIKNLLRPGHANFTYLEKYGCFDYRGGGRASARETACRVAAGAVANKLLQAHKINALAYIKNIAGIEANINHYDLSALHNRVNQSPLFCPDEIAEKEMQAAIEKLKIEGDSCGGVIELLIDALPVGLGEPVYQKLEAMLADAMMSIPASKGFEIGEGFNAAKMQGSEHNDLFTNNSPAICDTNHAGGTLGGISNGLPLIARVAFKPTSSIKIPQKTLNLDGNEDNLRLAERSRHDPCVAIRAVPVVEAMCALVIADALLLNRSAKL